MNKEDKRIVRKGVVRQYFPNDKGNFNNRELRFRSKGIKDIEQQYINRIKTTQGSPNGRRNRSTLTSKQGMVVAENANHTLTNFTRTPNKIGLSSLTANKLRNSAIVQNSTIDHRNQQDEVAFDHEMDPSLFRQSLPSRSISHSITASRSGRKQQHLRKKRPIDEMLVKAQQEKIVEEQVRKENEPTIKLPLIKGGDSLENLLNDLLSE